MKESQLKLLNQYSVDAKVLISPYQEGARSSSKEKGWMVSINGEPLESARRPVRVFASIDTAAETLVGLGVMNVQLKLSVNSEALNIEVPENKDPIKVPVMGIEAMRTKE